MALFFWQLNQNSQDLVREWAMFIFNFIIFLYTSFTLYKTWRHYRRFIFQLMPLTVNVFATFLLLLLKLFQKGYQFDQIGHLIEIFTYFLFCYTFALMYTKVNKTPLDILKIKRVWNGILVFFFLLLIIFSILVLVGIISKNCEQDQKWPAIAALIFQSVSFIPTAYYGRLIMNQLKIKNRLSLQEPLQTKIQTFTTDIYLKERRKQIIIVLLAYIVSLIIRIFLSITMVWIDSNIIECQQIDHIVILTSDYPFGQFLLFLIQINQLLPHIVIPIAMYIVPLQKINKSSSIYISSGLFDQEEEDENQDSIDQKISSMLSSRMSSDSPVLKSKLKKSEEEEV